jgi:serine protease inhibitor
LLFQGDRFGFIILLPNRRTGLPFIESNLREHPLSGIPRRMERKWIEIWLPKFKLSMFRDLLLDGTLAKVLQDICDSLGCMKEHFHIFFQSLQLRMASISYPIADFSGISCDRDLLFSNFIQQAFLEVNEEGTHGAEPTVLRELTL